MEIIDVTHFYQSGQIEKIWEMYFELSENLGHKDERHDFFKD